MLFFFIYICLLQACDILEGLIPSKEEKGVLNAAHLEKLFIFCIMWSLGALLELDDRLDLFCVHQSVMFANGMQPFKDSMQHNSMLSRNKYELHRRPVPFHSPQSPPTQ